METYEKDILKREITTEVKEDLTRSTGTNIRMCIVLAALILALEAFFWAAIIFIAAKDFSIGDGLFFSFMLCVLRIMQMNLICLSWETLLYRSLGQIINL